MPPKRKFKSQVIRRAAQWVSRSGQWAVQLAAEAQASADLAEVWLKQLEARWECHHLLQEMSETMISRFAEKGSQSAQINASLRKKFQHLNRINRLIVTQETKLHGILKKHRWQAQLVKNYQKLRVQAQRQSEKEIATLKKRVKVKLRSARTYLNRKALNPTERKRILKALKSDLKKLAGQMEKINRQLSKGKLVKNVRRSGAAALQNISRQVLSWAESLEKKPTRRRRSKRKS